MWTIYFLISAGLSVIATIINYCIYCNKVGKLSESGESNKEFYSKEKTLYFIRQALFQMTPILLLIFGFANIQPVTDVLVELLILTIVYFFGVITLIFYYRNKVVKNEIGFSEISILYISIGWVSVHVIDTIVGLLNGVV